MTKKLNDDLAAAVKNFQVEGDFKAAAPIGNGHIHDTYAADFQCGPEAVRYVVQRINHNVFRDPPKLTENIVRVTSHIRRKLVAAGVDDVDRKVMTAIPTIDGQHYCRLDNGDYWRMYKFIDGIYTCEEVEIPEQAYEAGRLFGLFQSMLEDLDGPSLHDTIPNFHDGPTRWAQFTEALTADSCDRAREAAAEVKFVQGVGWIFDVLPELVKKGEIPIRVTHNDTKVNNVLFDKATNKGLCVVDLDTVMSGLSLYDFGDLMRTSLSNAAEDERDLSKITLDVDRFKALVDGFLIGTGQTLNRAELDHLVHGGKMITLIMGVRFLTDYLNGDKYYKIERPSHNLDRCRTQLRLLELMIDKEDQMKEYVEQVSR